MRPRLRQAASKFRTPEYPLRHQEFVRGIARKSLSRHIRASLVVQIGRRCEAIRGLTQGAERFRVTGPGATEPNPGTDRTRSGGAEWITISAMWMARGV